MLNHMIMVAAKPR